MTKRPYLGFFEMPNQFEPRAAWLVARDTLRQVEQTADVQELLAECDRVIAWKSQPHLRP